MIGTWLQVYAAIWVATLGFAVLVAVVGSGLTTPARRVLEMKLTPSNNAPPSLGHFLWLVAHNVPMATWPLWLGVIGAADHRLTRQAADTLLLASLSVNVLQVAAALGAYGTAPLPYLPQLPLEWAGIALGACSWLVQRHRPLTSWERLVWLVVTAGLMFCAAALETVAVPHR